MGLAVLLAIQSVRPRSSTGQPVVVAAHDLPAGTTLAATDVRVTAWASGDPPSGASTAAADLVGQRLAGPVRSGEPLTDVRLTSPNTLAAAAGTGQVALPLRLADGEVASLLQPGSRVDVLAADGQGVARVVAEAARVLAVPASWGGGAGGTFGADATMDSFAGALVVVAVTPSVATELAGAAAVGPLSVTLRS